MENGIINRKGAKRVQDIPEEVLELLNKGEIETVNLMEWLAVDHLQLIQNQFPSIGIAEDNTRLILENVKSQKKPTTMNTIKLVGSMLYDLHPEEQKLNSIFKHLSTHLSDSIRCYAPYLKSLDKNLRIKEKLEQSKKLVADTHFCVRELVWMALRPEIDKNLDEAIPILRAWSKSGNENIRRFTTESTRPRGVWCKHIERLKECPEIALPILENLKSDHTKYVQDSVGNWLNDASKSKPTFVLELCEKWQKESPSKETEKIIKRARRTIDKK